MASEVAAPAGAIPSGGGGGAGGAAATATTDPAAAVAPAAAVFVEDATAATPLAAAKVPKSELDDDLHVSTHEPTSTATAVGGGDEVSGREGGSSLMMTARTSSHKRHKGEGRVSGGIDGETHHSEREEDDGDFGAEDGTDTSLGAADDFIGSDYGGGGNQGEDDDDETSFCEATDDVPANPRYLRQGMSCCMDEEVMDDLMGSFGDGEGSQDGVEGVDDDEIRRELAASSGPPSDIRLQEKDADAGPEGSNGGGVGGGGEAGAGIGDDDVEDIAELLGCTEAEREELLAEMQREKLAAAEKEAEEAAAALAANEGNAAIVADELVA